MNVQQRVQMMHQQTQHQARALEGFQETEQQHLLSKEKDKNRQTSLYFKLPQAKPILARHYIDHSKPKVLIRQVRVAKESLQLINGLFTCLPVEKVVSGRREQAKGESTLWRRFILSGNYRCLYAKYLNLSPMELQGKRLRVELMKLALNKQQLMATYVMDINFLTEGTPSLIRNLDDYSLRNDQLYLASMENDFEFDSRFQSGNLMYVMEKNGKQRDISAFREFSLILQNDINTKGYGNWFYFKFYSKKPGKYRFNLVNCQKNYSFFSCGMRPTVFSLQKYQQNQLQWHYDCQGLTYHRNDLIKDQSAKIRFNTLSFTYQQTIQNDAIYFSASLPYSYSKLITFIDSIERTARNNPNLYFRREALALTVSCNECPLLTVTWKRERRQQSKMGSVNKKKIVVMMARQHPGEVVSSFVAEGAINRLVQLELGESTVDLLKRYIFKIIPMANVDGVIYGNSRCDITGADPNRKWTKNQTQPLYPIIMAIKKLISGLVSQGYEIAYFIDLHGHSRKLGSFLYACREYDQVEARMFAWIMGQINPRFSYENCRFGISHFRRETARGYMMNIAANRKAMTLETSFFGWKAEDGVKPFLVEDLHAIGSSLVEAIHLDTFRNSKMINWTNIRNQIKASINKKGQQGEEENQQESSGSDSNPQADELTLKEKMETFVNPAAATKLGLIDVKIVEKARKEDRQKQIQQNQQPFSTHEVFTQDYDTILNQKYLQSQTLIKADNPVQMKQTKSATKIRPFRFASLDKKPLSLGKKIRIAIDVQRMEKREQKLSTPSLPSVVRNAKGTQFWDNLKKEYQLLVTQKKRLLQGEPIKNWHPI